jgi:hypothetical protein
VNDVANVSKLRNVIDYVGSDLRHFDKVQTEICLSKGEPISLDESESVQTYLASTETENDMLTPCLLFQNVRDEIVDTCNEAGGDKNVDYKDKNHLSQQRKCIHSHNDWERAHHVLPSLEMGCASGQIAMDLWYKMNCVSECENTDIVCDDFDVRDVEKIDKELIDRIEAHYSRLDREIEVIIDSGATNHMFPHMKFLENLRELQSPQYVGLGDPKMKLEIVARGTNHLVGDGLLVPNLQYGLISVPQLDKSGFETTFQNEKCWVYQGNNVIIEATLRHNLYFVEKTYLHKMSDISHESFESISDVRELINTSRKLPGILKSTDARDIVEKSKRRKFVRIEEISPEEQEYIDHEWYKLHNKWGHLSESRMRLAIDKGLTSSEISSILTPSQIARARLGLCYDCMRGRMKSGPHRPVQNNQYQPFEKIAVDYKGPLTPKSHNKFSGFYLFSDQASNFVWTYHVKKKSEFLDAFNTFMSTFQRTMRELNTEVRILQSDYDKVILDKKVIRHLADKYKIRHISSAPYVHQQNGQVERDMQNVLDRSRTIMSVHDAPPNMWEFAVKYACLLINYSPTSTTDHKTPYEIIYKKKPNISKLIPFYSPGVTNVTKEERKGKLLNYKAAPVRMLGYPDESLENLYNFIMLFVESATIRWLSQFLPSGKRNDWNQDNLIRMNHS